MAASKLETPKGNRGSKTGALTKADLIVLSLLAERSMNGYELVGEYERQEVADWASVSKAQVYYAIQKLTELEMIAPVLQTTSEGSRDRTIYQPTKMGQNALKKSLVGSNWAKARVANPFSTWLGLSIHLPQDAIQQMLKARLAFLNEEIKREKTSLAYIKTLRSARALAGTSIVDLVIKQFEVEIKWIESLLQSRTHHD